MHRSTTSSSSIVMAWISSILAILYIILYPPVYLIVSALQLILYLASPFLYLGRSILHATLLPYRILAKFEAVFIFFAVALLTGAVLGLILHYTCTFLVEWVHQSVKSPVLSRNYDESEEGVVKFDPKREEQDYSYSPATFSDPSSSRDFPAGWNRMTVMNPFGDGQLLSTTILEEDEYSDDSASY